MGRRTSGARFCDLVQTVTEDMDGVVAGVTGRNAASETVDLEMILLPLARDRALAMAARAAFSAPSPLSASPYWLGTRPVQSLHLGRLARSPAAARRGQHCPQAATRRCAGGALCSIRPPQAVFHDFFRANPALTPLE